MNDELNILSKGWELKKLGEICDRITKGATPTTYGYQYLDMGINFIKIENILNGKIVLGSITQFISKEAHENQKKSILEENDILFSIAGTIGETCIIHKEYLPANINQALAIIKGYNKYITAKFLKLQLESFVTRKVKAKARGGAMSNISLEDLKNMEIFLPPITIQDKIVEKIEKLFSELDSGVEELKKVREQLKVYRQSVLHVAFTGKLTEEWRKQQNEDWKYQLVADSNISEKSYTQLPEGWKQEQLNLLTEINPKLPNREISDNLIVSFIPMKRVEEISGIVDLTEKKKYSEVRKGFTSFINKDVIFAKITPCMENGKIAVVNNLENGIGFGSTEFHVLRCKESIINQYLFYFLTQDKYRFEAAHNMTGAVGQKRVPKSFIENSLIPLPSVKEQQNIIEEIESRLSIADEVEKIINESLLKAESMKQSILKKAFEGKLI
jgi:type I restriction enzyme, S subunit